MNLAKANCAGQGCDERKGCRRYMVMVPDGVREVNGAQVKVFNWASFDIEAQIFGGCASFVRYRD